jgi:light-regulated signal transduction histidine kinase (bacteriophytochrome)
MLGLSRVGRQEMKLEEVNLSELVEKYLQELSLSEPQRQAEFVVQPNVHARADARMIELALRNLLRNAWKFSSKRKLTRIEFGTMKSENNQVYFISDNGAGFDMKFADEIFAPFKRVHAEKEFGGTGVGLSIVQRVIKRHGGTVWARGEVGRGAAFYFTVSSNHESAGPEISEKIPLAYS